MCTILAILAFRAEAAEVKRTYLLLLVVFERAVWAKWAESTVVVWAGRPLSFGVDMKVEAIVAVRTGLCAGVV
jgi:hypothetical protein